MTPTVIMIILVYILPSIIAGARQCKAGWGILVVNLFLGWTFVGWVIALAWAVSGEKTAPATS